MTKLKDLWGKQVKEGCMFGAELEVESNTKLPTIDSGTWKTSTDPSLRSAYPFEYVTRAPIPFAGVDNNIGRLLTKLNDKEVSEPIRDSSTTSWHIHLNALEFTPVQLMTKLFLFWCIEPLVTQHCGSKRQQNTFALQLKDSYSTLNRFNAQYWTMFINNPRSLMRDYSFSQETRYGAQNLCALPKFGSVEYRAMRGTLEYEEITPWTQMLCSMWQDNSFSNPSEVLSAYYDKGSTSLIESTCGTSYFNKYWTSSIEEECEENALALLQVDDEKLFSWDQWQRKINQAYEIRKLDAYQNESWDVVVSRRSNNSRSPSVQPIPARVARTISTMVQADAAMFDSSLPVRTVSSVPSLREFD